MTDIKRETEAINPGGLHASMMVKHTPYAIALGMTYVSSSEDGRGTILLPWRADICGADGTDILAPGAVTALIDHACGLAIMAGFGLAGLALAAALALWFHFGSRVFFEMISAGFAACF